MKGNSSLRLLGFVVRKCFSPRIHKDRYRRYYCSGSHTKDHSRVTDLTRKLASGPSFQDFIKTSNKSSDDRHEEYEEHYIQEYTTSTHLRKGLNINNTLNGFVNEFTRWHVKCLAVYFETYGCQMNVNDTDIACSILQKAGYSRTHQLTEVPEDCHLLHTF